MKLDEKLLVLLGDCRDFVQSCTGSTYHETGLEEDQFLDRIDRELAETEWAGSAQGPGWGPMGSGGDGERYPACPVCRGLKEPNNSFTAEAVGHQPGCRLASILGKPTRKLERGEQGRMAL